MLQLLKDVFMRTIIVKHNQLQFAVESTNMLHLQGEYTALRVLISAIMITEDESKGNIAESVKKWFDNSECEVATAILYM